MDSIDFDGLGNTILIEDHGGRSGPAYGGTITVLNLPIQPHVGGSASSWPNPKKTSPGVLSGVFGGKYGKKAHKECAQGIILESNSKDRIFGQLKEGEDVQVIMSRGP